MKTKRFGLMGAVLIVLFMAAGCGKDGGGGGGQNVTDSTSLHSPIADIPAFIAGTPTVLTTTVFVPPSGANFKASTPAHPQPNISLERLDSNNVVISSMGNLHDDGLNGDAVAGDGVFSIQVTLTEQGPDPVRLRVLAITDPSSSPTVSDTLIIPIHHVPSTNTPADYNQVVSDLFVNLVDIRNAIVPLNALLSNLNTTVSDIANATDLLQQIINSSVLAYTNIVALKRFESSQSSQTLKTGFHKSSFSPGLVQDLICAIRFLGSGCAIFEMGQVGLNSQSRGKLFLEDGNDPRVKDVKDWALQRCGLSELEIAGTSGDPGLDRLIRLQCWKSYELALDSPNGASKELINIGIKFEIRSSF